jgi:hypothetical protein
VVSAQATMATPRPVDLSATRSGLPLSATTLLAPLVACFVGIDRGGVSVLGGGLLGRNECACTGVRAVR